MARWNKKGKEGLGLAISNGKWKKRSIKGDLSRLKRSAWRRQKQISQKGETLSKKTREKAGLKESALNGFEKPEKRKLPPRKKGKHALPGNP